MTDTFPVLYILMRNDMDSMNAGKGMAQASHASNAFVHESRGFTNHDELIEKWKNETEQGFGTVLVLAVNEREMRDAVMVAEVNGLVAGVVHDPTYPLRDGETTHSIPLDTCAYVFGEKDDLRVKAAVGRFPLHP